MACASWLDSDDAIGSGDGGRRTRACVRTHLVKFLFELLFPLFSSARALVSSSTRAVAKASSVITRRASCWRAMAVALAVCSSVLCGSA